MCDSKDQPKAAPLNTLNHVAVSHGPVAAAGPNRAAAEVAWHRPVKYIQSAIKATGFLLERLVQRVTVKKPAA